MEIITLAENTSKSDELQSEHGLSLFINTKKHKLLFDVGATSLFAINAKKLNVNLSDVDLVIISHGHYDHGGGLKTFLNLNSKAKIYFNQKAFQNHYANRPNGERVYIGLDKTLIPNGRFIFVKDRFIIDDELELFSNVKAEKLNPSGNKDLLMEEGTIIKNDDFSHEQNLIIKEKGKTVLVAGCAHNGIVNILEHLRKKNIATPTHVIGGFHLYNRSADVYDNPVLIRHIGEYIKETDVKYYTCHCTGIEPYKILKEIMGERIEYLSTGSKLII